ncbi:hypothetical protein E1J17_01440 [Kocuria rosea]|nr:hypothetical protein [Kocuria rosea]THE19334.1 hypothetical protein E1J17_01440 [Kocuria rosea]
MEEFTDVYLKTDAWVWWDLDLNVVPPTRPFRVNCMKPPDYGKPLSRPFRKVRECCWYHSVDWQLTTILASELLHSALVQLAKKEEYQLPLGYIIDDSIPSSCSEVVRQGIHSLISPFKAINATKEGIINGGHRITAMRQQGVSTTPAHFYAPSGIWLSEIPGVYPIQDLPQSTV